MQSRLTAALVLLFALFPVAGCEHHEKDSHTEVFKTPEQVSGDFKQFVEIVHGELPETWIYFVSIKPSIQRWSNWPKFQKTNALIANYIGTQPRVQFIDVGQAMLDAQGKPRDDIFSEDGLHMNARGYAIWTSIIKPVLLNRFANPN